MTVVLGEEEKEGERKVIVTFVFEREKFKISVMAVCFFDFRW